VIVVPGPLSRIQVTPFTWQIQAGSTGTFTATGYDANNNVVPITPVWSVIAGGGTISSTGVFTAQTMVGTFPATAQAASGELTATARVIVGPAGVNTIVVTPANPRVIFGATQQFTAVAYDQYMNVQPFTPTWAVSSAAGSITSAGVFSPKSGADGLFTNAVSASFGLVFGRVSVTVDCGC